MLVPSTDQENALEALDRAMTGRRSISGAVAFVSQAGVSLLGEVLSRHSSIEELHLVARGAPVTDPDALLMLKEEQGATVSVVVGAHASGFHPKLWLLEGDDGLSAVSGSGNLTAGGLRDNREQFEVHEVSAAADIELQWQRFKTLVEGAITLEEMIGSIAWREWREQAQKREWLAREQKRLDDRLSSSPARNMEEAKRQLTQDLWGIHDKTLKEKLPKPDGDTYNPGHFRLELEGHRGVTDPVHIVGRICRRKTKGFDVIRNSRRWDLTVESLVVDPRNEYYELFKGTVRELSERRLREEFPEWPGPQEA